MEVGCWGMQEHGLSWCACRVWCVEQYACGAAWAQAQGVPERAEEHGSWVGGQGHRPVADASDDTR